MSLHVWFGVCCLFPISFSKPLWFQKGDRSGSVCGLRRFIGGDGMGQDMEQGGKWQVMGDGR